MVTRVHNFILRNDDACYVFFRESVRSAGIDNTLKLIRLLLISLFLCFQEVI